MTMDLKVELTALAADIAAMSGRVTDFVAAMPEPGKPKAREPGWYWVLSPLSGSINWIPRYYEGEGKGWYCYRGGSEDYELSIKVGPRLEPPA